MNHDYLEIEYFYKWKVLVNSKIGFYATEEA